MTATQDAKGFLYKVQSQKNKTDLKIKNLKGLDRKNVLNLKILIGVDVSGSISSRQFNQFMRQIDRIKGLSVVKVIEIDDKIVAMYDYFKVKRNRIAKLGGGGGTEFTQFFQVANQIKPDAILFMTDGFVTGSVKNPNIPTGWILTSDGHKPYNFGEELFKL
jgi:predicted metal-dependent peptidase